LAVTYEPAGPGTALREPAADADAAFARLAVAAHVDKPAAWAAYERQMRSAGEFADTVNGWQRAEYLPGYHRHVEAATGEGRGSEVLSEFFVPRRALAAFLASAADIVRRRGANLIYGNVRLIEPDTVTALPWAPGRFACVVMNLHAEHATGLGRLAGTFRALLDAALDVGGTYYLAYHRWATPEQTRAAHPTLAKQLEEAETPRSDWARHYRRVL
jgi:hypothetical protein